MAITDKIKTPGKWKERLIFATSPIVFIWLFSISFSPDNNVVAQCNLGLAHCNETQAFYQGYIIGSFLVPILLGLSYLALGLNWRRIRIKKEKESLQ